ncbi:response regulator [Prevotella sp. E13-17]|uniref:response regulator n=1 Tax=Prevotella sp. E13-17 TaxID=2913616 RepID=UPI001EDABFD6|nr:response regulator [Prevotella sp. E13-17]UKK50422.1 response regulator [Prevotella sp. E13-17]
MNIAYQIALGIAIIAILIIHGRMTYKQTVGRRNRKQMEDVFTNISHELLTPLTVISASVEHLREQEPDHASDYALMQLNIERMVRLLQQILETSKSHSGELKLLVSQGDVMQYIRQTALCIEPLMHKHGQTFSIETKPNSMMGWIDTDKLDKIIYNLLSNAAKYTKADGNISLRVMTNKLYDHIIIQVKDDGIGISAHKMKNLYQRFHDGEYRRMQVKGNGLGLALTHDLVMLHGGTIDCESEENKGTTFTVTIPITKEAFLPEQVDENNAFDLSKIESNIIDMKALYPEDDKQLLSTAIPTINENAYRILLVEDNEELLMLMSTLLSKRYNIYTAPNGKEALKIIQSKRLDLIVSDVMMPEMDGNELTREIKSKPEWNHLPIILLTAKTSEEDRKASLTIGADDYIAKPFRLGDLELRIDNLISNRKRILEAAGKETTTEEQVLTADEEFMQRAHKCVLDHLDDSDFDREAFAKAMGASSSTLYNKLRVLTGMNITSYIRDIRMKEAKRLAETQSNLRVSDLAYRVGFKDPKYFATCFKKEFGIQPSEFIESLNNDTSTDL